MKKLLPLFILLFATAAFGQQQKCTKKSAEIPSLRGLKLFMTIQQVRVSYPNLKLEDSDFLDPIFGKVAFIDKKEIANINYAKNLDRIFFAFGDEKLTNFSLQYDNQVVWLSSEEFTKQITKTFQIPFTSWRVFSEKDKSLIVECFDFHIVAEVKNGIPELRLSESIEKWIQRVNEQKDAFKP